MPIPGSYPAKMTLADGRTAVVTDLNGYLGATQAGASYNPAASPIEVQVVSGVLQRAAPGTASAPIATGIVSEIVSEALNNEQSDTRPIPTRTRGSKL